MLLQKPIENSYLLDGLPIAAGEYPFKRDPVEGAAQLNRVLDGGVTRFIDLTTLADAMTPYEPELLKQADSRGRPLTRVSLGIPDMGVPARQRMVAILDAIDDAVRDGERVYVHCWGGVGRTGTVIGCYLVRRGMTPDDALKRVGELFATMSRAKLRGHPEGSPQTTAQRDFVRTWKEQARTSERTAVAVPVREAALLLPSSWEHIDRELTRRRSLGGDSVGRGLALRDRVRGSLIGLAAGDALGTAVEFRRPGSFTPLTDMVGGGPFHLAPGEWTDDTSMALCLAESLIEKRAFDPADQMQRYVRWWREGHLSSTGQFFDIGTTTAEALRRFERTDEPYAGPTERSRAANGSLMRLAPVPLFYWNSAEAIEISGRSSRTTHGSPLPVDACRYLGALIAGAVRGASRDALLSPHYEPWPGCWDENPLAPEIAEIAAGSFRRKQPPGIRGGGYCVDALEAALWAFHSSSDFRSGALLAVNLGDDADTTGAIYGQLAGAFYGESGIPLEWRRKLALKPTLDRYAEFLFQLSLHPLPELPSSRRTQAEGMAAEAIAVHGSAARALESIARDRQTAIAEEGIVAAMMGGSMGAMGAAEEASMLLRVELGLSLVD
jgi:ADP-ribosyl-[dinitrogen reductase] hydrolase